MEEGCGGRGETGVGKTRWERRTKTSTSRLQQSTERGEDETHLVKVKVPLLFQPLNAKLHLPQLPRQRLQRRRIHPRARRARAPPSRARPRRRNRGPSCRCPPRRRHRFPPCRRRNRWRCTSRGRPRSRTVQPRGLGGSGSRSTRDGVIFAAGEVEVPVLFEPLEELEVVLHFALDEAVDGDGLCGCWTEGGGGNEGWTWRIVDGDVAKGWRRWADMMRSGDEGEEGDGGCRGA